MIMESSATKWGAYEFRQGWCNYYYFISSSLL